MRATLTNYLGGTTVDPDLISYLCIFQKLSHVFVDSFCSKEGGCTFLFTGDDVTRLANALPDIKASDPALPVRPTVVTPPPSLSSPSPHAALN